MRAYNLRLRNFKLEARNLKPETRNQKPETEHLKPHNIIITGFMGTGKSTVAPLLANALGWKFVDMDALIEQREGQSIRKIFETAGEAYFRRLETELCRELNGWRERVIATGGGTLVNPQNLAIVSPQNLVICLDCAPDVLWQRLSTATDRPMLDAADARVRLFSLLAERQPAYARISHHIDVTRRSPAETVSAALEILQREV